MKRRRQSPVRRNAKWAGLVLTMLLAGTWLASAWCWVGYKVGTGRGPFFGISNGAAMEIWSVQGSGWPEPVGFSVRFKRASNPVAFEWWPRYDPALGLLYGILVVPLWPIAVLMGVATVGIWLWDGRALRAGFCTRCAYDLAGLSNPAAPCPECGNPAS